MTREEAVNELNDRIKSAEYVDSDYIDCVSVDAVKIAISALSVPETNVGDTISRQAAIGAMWKALYEYEDKMEKQFIKSDDLDIEEWILHRIFVQNMSDIDRKVILDLPSVEPELIRCKDCKHYNSGFECLIEGYGIERDKDWFCGSAERKEEDD